MSMVVYSNDVNKGRTDMIPLNADSSILAEEEKYIVSAHKDNNLLMVCGLILAKSHGIFLFFGNRHYNSNNRT